MFGLIHSSLRRGTRSLVRTLMLMLGVLGMPSTGQAAVNGSHCARLAPCTGASSSVIAVTAPTPIALSTARVRILPIRDAVRSVLRQPPTPPPLLVS